MSTLEGAYLSGYVGYVIAVPLIRLLSSLLMAVAVVKDCKVRNYKNRWIAVVAVFASPVLASLAYFVYSRFISKRTVHKTGNEKTIRSARRLCFLSVFSYLISFLLVVSAVLTIGISGLTSVFKGEILFPCYDRNGNEYSDSFDVPLYDENGNRYVKKNSDDNWFDYYYVDQNAKEYSGENSYITEDGYFFYDAENRLSYSDEDDYYYMKDGNDNQRYYHLDFNLYWDKNGDIWVDQGRGDYKLFE